MAAENHVTVITRPGQGPFLVQSRERRGWVKCPGEWRSLADATRFAEQARGVYEVSTEFRVIGALDVDRDRRVAEFVMGLKDYELERRGIVRVGDALRSGDDLELDAMWAPRGRAARARQPDPASKPHRLASAVGFIRSLRLEFIGHDVWTIARVRGMKPWAAEVGLAWSDFIGRDGRRRVEVVDRVFLDGETDYESSDKTGGRGILRCFLARQGLVYEIFDRARQAGPRRVFVLHDGQCWHDLTPQEAIDAQGSARHQGR